VLGVYTSVIAPSVISADSPRFLGFIPRRRPRPACCSTCWCPARDPGHFVLEASGAIAAENSVLRVIGEVDCRPPPAAASCRVVRQAICPRSRRPERPPSGAGQLDAYEWWSALMRIRRSRIRCSCWRWTPW
jgi:hypothetical protein